MFLLLFTFLVPSSLKAVLVCDFPFFYLFSKCLESLWIFRATHTLHFSQLSFQIQHSFIILMQKATFLSKWKLFTFLHSDRDFCKNICQKKVDWAIVKSWCFLSLITLLQHWHTVAIEEIERIRLNLVIAIVFKT